MAWLSADPAATHVLQVSAAAVILCDRIVLRQTELINTVIQKHPGTLTMKSVCTHVRA